ncbi:MAG: sugar ABC transporter permease [Oscillospiraceae bacterium]
MKQLTTHPKNKKRDRYFLKTKLTPWLILAIPILLTLWLKYYPILSAIFMSLFDYSPIDPPGKFIGLQNYITMFSTQYYWQAWVNSFIFLGLSFAMSFFIPIIQALLLNELIFMKKTFTTLYIIPALIPSTVNVIIWKWIWNPDYGVANQIIRFFGGQPQAWLSDPNWTKFCIIFPGVIGGGLGVLLYLSAIQSTSNDVLESSRMEGCDGWKRIWYIILPNIKFMIFIQMIFAVIGTLQLLDVPYMYASGGPSGASTTMGIYIYRAFSGDLNYGRGAAASTILLLVIAVITMIEMHFERSEQE